MQWLVVGLQVVWFAVPVGIGLAVARRSPQHPAVEAAFDVLCAGAVTIVALSVLADMGTGVVFVPAFLVSSAIAAVTAALSTHARQHRALR